MAIKKTKHNTYLVRLYYPKEIQELLSVGKLYSKTCKTRLEAKETEINFHRKNDELLRGLLEQTPSNGDILFSSFYEQEWLDAYKLGQTTTRITPPTPVTVTHTEGIFRLHILPMFGKYTLNYLNDHKAFVIKEMTKKAATYRNFKTIRSYVNSIFDWAEELEHIERNKLEKSLRLIKSAKKNQLDKDKKEEEQYLSLEELKDWIDAINEDLDNQLLSYQDFALFMTTLLLSSRKSETYALKWKDINFINSTITVSRALDKFGNEKNTKGNKKTIFNMPDDLSEILRNWEKEQKEQLILFNIKQTKEQYVFSYTDRKGNINTTLHTDYLNYRMDSIKRRHPNLAFAKPHMLRHTGATLAKKFGISLKQISEGLTHSDTSVTKAYINTPDVVNIPIGEIVYQKVKEVSKKEDKK